MDNHDEQAAYEARLRRRLELLKQELEAGKIKFAEGLGVVESLQKIRTNPDGSIDLETVDGSVRSLALAAEFMHDRKELKEAVPLPEIQEAYFSFIDQNFGRYFQVMKERDLTPHDAGMALSQNAETIAGLIENLPQFLEVIEEFWSQCGDAAHAHMEDMHGCLKGVFGGDLFPSPYENLASKCGLYTDTLILPCPFLRTKLIFSRASDQKRAYYMIKHAMNLLQYKELACADLSPPIVVVLPDMAVLQEDEQRFFAKLGQQDALIHSSKIFGRSFESFEELMEFAGSLPSFDLVEKAVVDPSRVLFDSEVSGGLKEQLSKASGGFSGLLGTDHCGAIVASNAAGRMATCNELLIKARRLQGTPVIDAPTSWQYFGWKLEYDAERVEGNDPKEALHVLRGLQHLAENEMTWLGNVPPEALVAIRKDGALAEIRQIIGQGVQELAEANPNNFHRTSDQIFENFHAAFDLHKRNVDELRSKGWKFAGSDIGSWFVVGSLAVAATATGIPAWGLAAIAADQLLDAPKLRDIPKSIRDLAEENNRVKRSPVGMLFKLSHAKA
ncbi:hypothetical protein ACLD02_18005 [Alloalcanivorax sp. C16-2]|uniref:hypothetical protein n=1 Tax=Alloalcanivorax TaxID=3020832 RepID=UPI0019315B7C|nr:hypothetical protein [Alloalcanivorax marinus]MBL7252166.1 hypothetical protein [Alloalcanivorax marinus]